MLEQFIERIQAIYPVSEALRERLLEDTELLEAPKGTVLLRDGQRSDYVYMVLKGLLRSYYIKDDEEICSRFMPEGYLVLSVHSFWSRQPGYEFIEAVEDSTLVRLHHDKLQRIYREFMEFNFIGRELTQFYFRLMEQRSFILRKMQAEERWRYFLENYPELVQRVPLKYIATFLGMNLETLSRMRRKLAGG